MSNEKFISKFKLVKLVAGEEPIPDSDLVQFNQKNIIYYYNFIFQFYYILFYCKLRLIYSEHKYHSCVLTKTRKLIDVFQNKLIF